MLEDHEQSKNCFFWGKHFLILKSDLLGFDAFIRTIQDLYHLLVSLLFPDVPIILFYSLLSLSFHGIQSKFIILFYINKSVHLRLPCFLPSIVDEILFCIFFYKLHKTLHHQILKATKQL